MTDDFNLRTVTEETRKTALQQTLEARERDYVFNQVQMEVETNEQNLKVYEERQAEFKAQIEKLQSELDKLG